MRKRLLAGLGSLILVGACSAGEEQGDDATLGQVQQASSNHGTLGIHCTNTYEHNWISSREAGWAICDGVWNNLDATPQFRYNLVGKQYYWHSGGDGATNSLEDVDLFFGVTHGGALSTYSRWSMWDDDATYGPPNGIRARSDSMWLGNEGHRLSIFAVHACHTLQFDGNFWTRWDSVFSGLRMALGSHHEVHSGTPDQYIGEDFADYLNDHQTFKSSWCYAYDSTAYNDQDPAIATTGWSGASCQNRRDGMRWSNYTQYSRSADYDDWCGWYWDAI